MRKQKISIVAMVCCLFFTTVNSRVSLPSEECHLNTSDYDLMRILVKYGNNSEGIPALHYAIKQKDFKAVCLLLDNGANPNAKTSSYGRMVPTKALDYAAMYGTSIIINLLIARGATIQLNVEEKLQGVLSPLCFAVIANHHDVMETLVINGAEIFFEHPYPASSTPLYLGVLYGDVETIKFLIDNGASINDPIYENSSLLDLATRYNKLDSVEYLLNLGAEVEKDTWAYAARIGNYNLFNEFLRIGVDVNECDSQGNSALIHAISSGNLDFIKFLLNSGANVNTSNSQGITVLMLAIKSGRLDLVECLVGSGADVNGVNPYKNNRYTGPEDQYPIIAALHFPLILEFLINAGADINVKLDQRNTPLHYATGLKNAHEALGILLKYGADPNALDLNGRTPLHLAVSQNDNKKLINTLLDNGANLHAKDYSGWKPWHLAYTAYQPDIDILEDLLSRGASLNELDPVGHNALHHACSRTNEKGKLTLIKFLVEDKKMNINEHSMAAGGIAGSLTPLASAVGSQRNDDFEILDYLVAKGANLNIKVLHFKSILDWALSTRQPHHVIEWLRKNGAR